MTQRGASYERNVGDQYMTPEWAVLALLKCTQIFGCCWEPACGEGMITRTVAKVCPYAEVIGTDIEERYTLFPVPFDYLTTPVSEVFEMNDDPGEPVPIIPLTIITNPPYGRSGKLARAFVEKALRDTQPSNGRVIMLLPADWDCAGTRAHLFENFAGHITKITLARRIRWTNLEQKKNGPSANHAWFVWDHARKGRDMRWV